MPQAAAKPRNTTRESARMRPVYGLVSAGVKALKRHEVRLPFWKTAPRATASLPTTDQSFLRSFICTSLDQ
jgi:hypothetical protein